MVESDLNSFLTVFKATDLPTLSITCMIIMVLVTMMVMVMVITLVTMTMPLREAIL